MPVAKIAPHARQVILFNAVFWLAVTAFHHGEAAISGMRIDWPAIVGRIGADTLGFLLSTLLTSVALASAGPDLRPRLRPMLGTAVLFAVLLSAADYLTWYVFLAQKPPLDTAVMLALHIGYRLSHLLACYGLYSTLFYSAALREREHRLLEARSQAREAQFRALRYQVNPHLLFNALNALSALVVTGKPREAGEMIDRLARFYRAALAPDPMLKVTLAQELELQSHYLDIERTRFPDRMRFLADVEPGLNEALVPHLLLQPLVENAVRHGVAASLESVEIRLQARRGPGSLVLRVENTGARNNGGVSTGRVGIGLANVRERLRAYYGDSGTLDTSTPEPGRFRAEIRLPLEVTL